MGAVIHKGNLWIRLTQAGWWVFTCLSMILFLITIPVYFQQLNQICVKQPCLAMQLSIGQAIILELSAFKFSTYAQIILGIQGLVYLLNLAIGMFIYIRKSKEWLAVIVSLMLITTFSADLYTGFQIAYPAAMGLALLLMGVNTILLIVFLYIFPTGSFLPRWTALLAVFWILILFTNSIFPSLTMVTPGRPELFAFLLLAGLFVSSILVLLYRYRVVFNPIQRDQTKWVVFGVVVTWGGEIMFNLLRLALPIFSQNAVFLISWNIITLTWTLIFPVSMLFAVLSSALLDIDVLIRRTLAYTVVIISLLIIYIGSVLLLQKIFEVITDQRSPLISIISTLVIAAISTPLRQRIQDNLNKIFFRNHYNTELTVQEFSESARSDVDLDEISTQLVHVVQNTLQPEFLSLWLCKVSEDVDLNSPDILR